MSQTNAVCFQNSKVFIYFHILIILFILDNCQAKGKSFYIGQKPSGSSTDFFDKGNDYVFVLLPCDKSKYSIDLSSSARKLLTKQRNYIL